MVQVACLMEMRTRHVIRTRRRTARNRIRHPTVTVLNLLNHNTDETEQIIVIDSQRIHRSGQKASNATVG